MSEYNNLTRTHFTLETTSGMFGRVLSHSRIGLHEIPVTHTTKAKVNKSVVIQTDENEQITYRFVSSFRQTQMRIRAFDSRPLVYT